MSTTATPATPVASAADVRLCKSPFTHPGWPEAMLRVENHGRPDMESLKPFKGKQFVCDKPVDGSGKHLDGNPQHGCRIRGDGHAGDFSKGIDTEDIRWE